METKHNADFSIARILGETKPKNEDIESESESGRTDEPGPSSYQIAHPLPETDLQDMFNPNLWSYYTQSFINKQIFGLNGNQSEIQFKNYNELEVRQTFAPNWFPNHLIINSK
ncbi:hypothetical protein CAPTEDRAFT_207267 [Capitella teleta]|uniref:Uncharacterized protein n=1 Tax=Capitella teleta TaxID=283909 RepID=R7UX24_CAPTE|nr:hypothetical protein CAPTEDRAFT_207267 [Capitella teleta]|eukprot:ELU07956.1 hypothetical protein CAPTEDRAFT_207267 [Capitella teleta]